MCRAGLCRYDQIFSAIDARRVDLGNVAGAAEPGSIESAGMVHLCRTALRRRANAGGSRGVRARYRAGSGNVAGVDACGQFRLRPGAPGPRLRTDQTDSGANGRFRPDIVFLFDAVRTSGFETRGGGGSRRAAGRERLVFLASRIRLRCETCANFGPGCGRTSWWTARSATDFAWAFWQRKAFTAAQDAWADWLASFAHGYLHPQRLANVRFEDEPNGSPFDWTLTPAAGAEIRRSGGLDIHFSGTANIDFSNVRQFTTVNSGRYRFSAEIEAEALQPIRVLSSTSSILRTQAV